MTPSFPRDGVSGKPGAVQIVGVMWRMVDGVPTIAWIGFDNFTSIAP
jgi:hypothetical protein